MVGLSISQWLPCPFAIWNLLFGMAILLNLVKVYYIILCGCVVCVGRRLRPLGEMAKALQKNESLLDITLFLTATSVRTEILYIDYIAFYCINS